MIVDVRELADGSRINADLVIIGGGLAGITLAREWAGGAKSVAILESGGREKDDKIQDLYAGSASLRVGGTSEVRADEYMVESRARFYGGSGNWWGGKCVPLDPADFEKREWIDGSGWPITRAELQPYYNRACDVLAIPHFDRDYSEPQHEGRPPLAINGSTHVTSLPRDHTKVTGRHREVFDEFCYGFTDAENISVYLHATVTNFSLSADGARVASVTVGTLGGKKLVASGSTFVLACGGIENARILLAANARDGSRFGHRSNALGRYFQGHAVIGADRTDTSSGTRIRFTTPQSRLGLYVDRAPGKPHAVLGMTSAGQRHYQSAAFTVTMGFDPRVPGTTEQTIGAMAARVDQKDPSADEHLGVGCYFMSENMPNGDSRVELAKEASDELGVPRAALRWEFGAADVDVLERSVDSFAREMGAAGLARTSFPIARERLIESFSPSRHHMGTTRMHVDADGGVVDADLRVHDAANLYIAGSSVFPTSGIANPTLTILALTLRLSDHLKKKLAG